MRIAYVSSDYHWESYSVLRSLYEALCDQADVMRIDKVYYPLSKWPDYIFLAGNDATTEANNAKVVRIGFSDPNLFDKAKAMACDQYCTNDYRISKQGYYHFPVFCDPKYFADHEVEKDTDVLFFGIGNHPYVHDRIETVTSLREAGVSVKVLGGGWPPHEDNHPHVEGNELVRQINRAHLVLDLTNDETALGSRILQASCCGVPVISKWRADVVAMFDTSEIVTYRDRNELKAKILFWLGCKSALAEIGGAARLKCLEEHTVAKRVHDLMEYLKK